MKIGIVGNTELTRKGLDLCLSLGHSVCYINGLPPELLKNKVNGVDLASFCKELDIPFYSSNDFSVIKDLDVDLIVVLGDSRILPISEFRCKTIIGNHGAELPSIKGGASIVWARMINNGNWAVSLMSLSEAIDSGDIWGINRFIYDPSMSMADFVNLCDDKTVELLGMYLEGYLKHSIFTRKNTLITLHKHVDSEVACSIAKLAIKNDIPIYLPSRTPEDSKVKDCWGAEFKHNFRIANSYPYIEAK